MFENHEPRKTTIIKYRQVLRKMIKNRGQKLMPQIMLCLKRDASYQNAHLSSIR